MLLEKDERDGSSISIQFPIQGKWITTKDTTDCRNAEIFRVESGPRRFAVAAKIAEALSISLSSGRQVEQPYGCPQSVEKSERQ